MSEKLRKEIPAAISEELDLWLAAGVLPSFITGEDCPRAMTDEERTKLAARIAVAAENETRRSKA